MMFCTEELVGEYLIPTLTAIQCDSCQKIATLSKEMEEFEQLASGDKHLDLCPDCYRLVSLN